MQIADTAIRETYLSVINELSCSDFAQNRGLQISPQYCHLRELAAISAVLPQDGRLLDVGTGIGVVPETMLRLGHRIVCVDTARNEKGREPLARLIALGAEGYFAVVGQEPIPIADGSVDVVFAGDVIEHLPGTPRHFLTELARVLKPGGHIVLTTPNAVRLTVRIRVALGYSNWPPVSIYLGNSPTPPYHASHHHEYTSAEIDTVLRDAGFKDVRTTFFEDTLRQPGILASFGDLRAQDRFCGYWSTRARRRMNPLGLIRLAMLGVTFLAPRLRSTLLTVACK